MTKRHLSGKQAAWGRGLLLFGGFWGLLLFPVAPLPIIVGVGLTARSGWWPQRTATIAALIVAASLPLSIAASVLLEGELPLGLELVGGAGPLSLFPWLGMWGLVIIPCGWAAWLYLSLSMRSPAVYADYRQRAAANRGVRG